MCSEPLVMNLDIRVLGFTSTKVKHVFFTSCLIVTLVVDKTRTATDWLQTIEAWSLKHQVVKQQSKRLVDDIFPILRIKNNVQPLLESKQENWPPELNQYFKKHQSWNLASVYSKTCKCRWYHQLEKYMYKYYNCYGKGICKDYVHAPTLNLCKTYEMPKTD